MAEIKLPNSTQIEAVKNAVEGTLKVELNGSNIKRGEELALNVTAYPKAPLKINKIINTSTYGTPIRPRSVGIDGALYGSGGDRRIHRTSDAYETIEYGANMSNLDGWTTGQSVAFVTQTYAGYVVIGSDAVNAIGSIWFSAQFETGFTKVADLANGYPVGIATSIFNAGEKQTVILVGEYGPGQPIAGEERGLFASFDGGATFSVILKLPQATDLNKNHHFHACIYDPYDSRIYASVGDGGNALIYYSDDLGINWSTIPSDSVIFEGQNQQPTLMIAFPDKVATGPDAQTPPVILSYYKDRQFTLPNTEVFDYRFDYAILSKSSSTGASSYSSNPIAQKGIEAYFIVPGFASRPCIIVGTGDGGNTFHKVFSLSLSRSGGVAQEGIVGPDKNGLLYMFFTDPNPRMLVLNMADWHYS